MNAGRANAATAKPAASALIATNREATGLAGYISGRKTRLKSEHGEEMRGPRGRPGGEAGKKQPLRARNTRVAARTQKQADRDP